MVFLSPVWPSTFCHHKGTAPLLFFRLSLLDGREEYPAYSETLGGVLESAQTGDWTRKRCLPPPGSRRVPALNGGVQVSWGLHKQGMDGAWDGQTDQRGCSSIFQSMYCQGEEGDESKGEALDLRVNIYSYSRLWSTGELWVMTDTWLILDKSSQIGFPPHGGRAFPQRMGEEIRLEPLIVHNKRSQDAIWIPPVLSMVPGGMRKSNTIQCALNRRQPNNA